MRRPTDLLLVLGVAASGGVALLAPGIAAVRVAAALVLILLTGHAVSSAVFARRSLDPAERLVFGLGSSFATLIIGGLVLNVLPWGLTRSTWVTLLVGTAAVAAVARRVQERGAIARGPGLPFDPPTAATAALLALAGVTICVAVVVGRIVPGAQTGDGYTALWLLPKPARAAVLVGVESEELEQTQYRLELRLGRRLVLDRPLTLATGERWRVDVRLPRTARPNAVLNARLYRASRPGSVYRRARLVLR